jgi:hypothetical protein
MENHPDLEVEKLDEEKAKRNKKIILFVLFLYMAFSGSISSLPDDYIQLKGIVDLINGPLLISVALVWCMYDSMSRGAVLGLGWSFGIFLLSPIVVPAYFYTMYGAKTGTIKTLMAFATLLAAIFVSVFASAITETILKT